MVWVDQRQLGHMSHTDVNLFHLDQHFLVEMVEDKEECCYGKVCRCWPSGVGKRTVRFPTLAPHCYTRPPARNAFSKPTAMLSLYFTLLTMQHNALQLISHSMKISFCEILYQRCATIQSNSLSSQLLSLSCGTMMVAPRRAFTSGLGCFTCVGMSLSMKEPSKYKMNASALIQWLGANSTEVCIHEVSTKVHLAYLQ